MINGGRPWAPHHTRGCTHRVSAAAFIIKSLFLWSAVVDKNKLKCVRKIKHYSANDFLCSFILGLVAGLFINGYRLVDTMTSNKSVLVRSFTDSGSRILVEMLKHSVGALTEQF